MYDQLLAKVKMFVARGFGFAYVLLNLVKPFLRQSTD